MASRSVIGAGTYRFAAIGAITCVMMTSAV